MTWIKNTTGSHWTHRSHKLSRERMRKPKGVVTGGQFAKDPNGPMSASEQAKLFGNHPEKVGTWTRQRRAIGFKESIESEEDARQRDWRRKLQNEEHEAKKRALFKEHKKEAMDRFLARQKKEREEMHAVGMPGPVTIKKLNKLKLGGEQPGAQLRNKLRKLERIAHIQGKEGFNTVVAKGKQPLKVRQANEISTGGQHERHVVLREAKAKEEFMEGKRIAGRRHNAKVRGVDFTTPAKPGIDVVSPGGKFKVVEKRNVHGRRMRDKNGNLKGTWRLIPTEQRGGNFPPPLPHAGRKSPSWPNGIAPVTRQGGGDPYSGGHKDMNNGKVLLTLPNNEQGNKGIFESQVNDIQGDGRAILKSNGRGAGAFGVDIGFAYREVAAYKVDQLLGLNVVPFTEEFNDHQNQLHYDHGDFHSLQHFVKGEVGYKHPDTGAEYAKLVDKSEVSKTLLLDILFQNYDCHGDNYMLGEGHFYAIDNGLSMFSDNTDVVDAARGWRCDFEYYARTEPPLLSHNNKRFKLSLQYKTKLDTILKDGSLKTVIDWVNTGTRRGDKNIQANYTLERAKNLITHWDEIFVD